MQDQTQISQPKTLSHGSIVRLASWTNSVAHVGTLNGYCTEDTAAMARARGDAECWAVHTGAALCADKSFYARERAAYDSATVIADGERVHIENTPYIVKVMRGNDGNSPRNSDPIKFVRA